MAEKERMAMSEDMNERVLLAAQEILTKYNVTFWPGNWPGSRGCAVWNGPMDQDDQLRCLEILAFFTKQSS